MTDKTFRIRLKYKHNKLKTGPRSKVGSYFFGGELPDYLGKDGDPRKRELFLSERVIYHDSKNNKDPNNGLSATIVKIYKPESDAEKYKKLEVPEVPRGTDGVSQAERDALKVEAMVNKNVNMSERPAKCPCANNDECDSSTIHLCNLHDLTFELSELDLEERRLNLAEANIRALVKRNMRFVSRDKLKSLFNKKLIVNIQQIPEDMNKAKKKVEKEVKETLKVIFKNGVKFKPKYVDKDTSSYSSMEEWKENELPGYKGKRTAVIKGDMLEAQRESDRKKRKRSYEKNNKTFTIKTLTVKKIENIDTALQTNSDYIRSTMIDSFYRLSNDVIDLNSLLVRETREWLVQRFVGRGDGILAKRLSESTAFFKSYLNISSCPAFRGGRVFSGQELRQNGLDWKKFLTTFILTSVWEDVNEHRLNGWRQLEDNKHLFNPAAGGAAIPYLPQPGMPVGGNSIVNPANGLPCRLKRVPGGPWPWASIAPQTWEHVPLPPITREQSVGAYEDDTLNNQWQNNLRNWQNFFSRRNPYENGLPANLGAGETPPFINLATRGWNIFKVFDKKFFKKPAIEQLFYVSRIIGTRTNIDGRRRNLIIHEWRENGIHHFINTYGDLATRNRVEDIKAACDRVRIAVNTAGIAGDNDVAGIFPTIIGSALPPIAYTHGDRANGAVQGGAMIGSLAFPHAGVQLNGNPLRDALKQRFVPNFDIPLAPPPAPNAGHPAGTGGVMPNIVPNLGDSVVVGRTLEDMNTLVSMINVNVDSIFSKRIIDGRMPEINVEVMFYFSEGDGFSNDATARCQQALDETIGALLGKVSEKMGTKKEIRFGGSNNRRTRRRRRRKKKTLKKI